MENFELEIKSNGKMFGSPDGILKNAYSVTMDNGKTYVLQNRNQNIETITHPFKQDIKKETIFYYAKEVKESSNCCEEINTSEENVKTYKISKKTIDALDALFMQIRSGKNSEPYFYYLIGNLQSIVETDLKE